MPCTPRRIRPSTQRLRTPTRQLQLRKTITAPRPPANQHRGEPTAYNGTNAPVPAIGEINGYRAVSSQADTLTCIWRYRYNGDTSEQWFTSGEAHNLACKPNGEIGCPTGSEPSEAPDTVADLRAWDKSGIPSGQVKQVYTSSELETLAQQWNLTTDELTEAQSKASTDFGSPSSLPFGSGGIKEMIEEVLDIL